MDGVITGASIWASRSRSPAGRDISHLERAPLRLRSRYAQGERYVKCVVVEDHAPGDERGVALLYGRDARRVAAADAVGHDADTLRVDVGAEGDPDLLLC